MSDQYFIKHPTKDWCIHYNPNTGDYFVGGKLLGAALFTKSKGEALMRDANIDADWKLVPVNGTIVATLDRSEEHIIFDATH